MIITLCNQKGGAGKTTLSFLLASAFAEIGKSVGVIDFDPQQTATRAITNLAKIDGTKINLTDDPAGFDIVFIDTPPRLDETLAKALGMSDKVVLVSSPSPADLWSTQESRDFVEKHSRLDASKKLLFNSVVKTARLSKDLDVIAEAIGFDPLSKFLTRKQAYQYAILQGWAILKPAERSEIQDVAMAILV